MWIGLFSESEEPDLDSITAWVGEPVYVASKLVDALDAHPWAAHIQQELVSAALDRQEVHFDYYDDDFGRVRVSFRQAINGVAPEGS